MLSRVHVLLAALWWGGTTALAFVAVPVLFSHFDTPAVAGAAAAQLFAALSVATVVLSGAGLLLLSLPSAAHKPLRWMWASAGALAVSNQWLIAPFIVSARATGGNLALWHSAGSALILAQWLLGLLLLWRLSKSPG